MFDNDNHKYLYKVTKMDFLNTCTCGNSNNATVPFKYHRLSQSYEYYIAN